ncbi:hypothetical protein F3F96_00760 [Mariprofundus sp. NF]|uniref:DUF6988 family protein n=1 Tax=Mariprofundus sp. NF TaxID=2608716 RepID=UPI0015A4A757|nr:hypothetical protein [Mariprofundus sp. NF]NWF37670.1 hypothetical protein [Mariprofundus sp. NF]
MIKSEIVAESKEIASWLHNKIDGLSVPGHEKGRASASCFDVVFEHQQAFTILIDNKLYGSAFVLARSAFEAYIRGIWLNKCASDDQFRKFMNETLNPSLGKLISDVEELDGYSEGVLSTVKASGWSLLCSFTHSGFNQLSRRVTDEYIEPNYSDNDVIQIAGFVNSMALLAGVEVAILTGNTKLPVEFVDKMDQYVANSIKSTEC